jgi:menaquinone-9 beta-reductase
LPESVLRRHRGDLDRLADDVFAVNPVLHDLWRAGQPSGEWKTIADVRVQMSTPSLPGILYVGDAKGTIDPLGGQGMTMALLGAEMLAPFVTRALSEGGANDSLQRAFGAAWHRRFDRRISLCRAFHHVLLNAWFVDAASAFTNLAPRLLALGFNRTRDPATAAV